MASSRNAVMPSKKLNAWRITKEDTAEQADKRDLIPPEVGE